MVQRDKKQSITNCTSQLQSLVIQMQTCSKCKLAMERCQWTTRTTVVRSKVDVTHLHCSCHHHLKYNHPSSSTTIILAQHKSRKAITLLLCMPVGLAIITLHNAIVRVILYMELVSAFVQCTVHGAVNVHSSLIHLPVWVPIICRFCAWQSA